MYLRGYILCFPTEQVFYILIVVCVCVGGGGGCITVALLGFSQSCGVPLIWEEFVVSLLFSGGFLYIVGIPFQGHSLTTSNLWQHLATNFPIQLTRTLVDSLMS